MNMMLAVAGTAIVAALAIGIGTKYGEEEAKIGRVLQMLEKQPDARKSVAAFLYFKEQCQLTYPQPIQTAFDRYVRVHPEVKSERVFAMPKNGAEAIGFAIGMSIGCPMLNQALAQLKK